MTDQIGLWAGFVLTLIVFSYLLGDNFLFRLALYVFVGLAAGFVTMVTVNSVIIPWVNATILNPDGSAANFVVGIAPFFVGLLLLARTTQTVKSGALGLAFIVGIGAAVAVIGAVSGTLIPLTAGTINDVRTGTAEGAGNFDLLNGFLIAFGVICTLVYFQYGARRVPGTQAEQELTVTRRNLVARAFGAVGQGFIVITMAAIYGGAILSGLTIFADRITYLLQRIFTGGG